MTAQKVEGTALPTQSTRSGFRITLWHVSLLLVLFGIAVSGYLSYVKFTNVPMICTADGPFQCDVVQNSAYSRLFGVPIAYLGLGMYLTVGALLLLENRTAFLRENGIMITFGIVLFAFLFSMYLVYVQGVILQAWCQWCLMHEANMTVLFIVTSLRLRQALLE